MIEAPGGKMTVRSFSDIEESSAEISFLELCKVSDYRRNISDRLSFSIACTIS